MKRLILPWKLLHFLNVYAKIITEKIGYKAHPYKARRYKARFFIKGTQRDKKIEIFLKWLKIDFSGS